MIQTCNETYKTNVALSKLYGVLSEDLSVPALRMYTNFWEEHIESEKRRRQRTAEGFSPSASMFCSAFACPKEVAFKAQNAEPDGSFNWRTRNVFWSGHAHEAYIKTLLWAAGIGFVHHDSVPLPDPWTIDGKPIYVGPDGTHVDINPTSALGYVPENIILEVKSISTKGFAKLERLGVGSSKPGYYEQCQLGMLGHNSEACLFIAINKDTGHMFESWILRDETTIAALTNLMLDSTDPPAAERPVFYTPEAVTVYRAGKKRPSQNATPRTRKGKDDKVITYGWDETVCYAVPLWPCSYCSYLEQCWELEYNVGPLVEHEAAHRHIRKVTKK
jgi:hypothetical protein